MFYLDFSDICNDWRISGVETASKKRQDCSQQDSGDLGPLAGSAVGLLGDLGQLIYPPLCLHLGSGNTDACQLCKLARLQVELARNQEFCSVKDCNGRVQCFICSTGKWGGETSKTLPQGNKWESESLPSTPDTCALDCWFSRSSLRPFLSLSSFLLSYL